MEDIAIKVEGVSKTFKLPHEKHTSIKSAFVNFYKPHKKGYELQKALDNVSFEVKKGEFFGIVGRNGSGKSTLLKLLAGIYSPTAGSIHVNGKLTPFIELGVGFNMELTGRENVFLNGALLGFSRKEMQAMYKDIVEFAELEKFMDQKLKNYSSGMQVRLAFSIAIRAESEILLIDEVLAVGDAAFQRKCFDVFRELKKQKRTIVLVTHDMSNVERFCDRTLVLDNGDFVTLTSSQDASSIYARINAEQAPPDQEPLSGKEVKSRWGTGEIKIIKARLDQPGNKSKKIFEAGKPLKVHVDLKRDKGHLKKPIVCGLAFINQDGVTIAGPNSLQEKIAPGASTLEFGINSLNFAPGDYKITLAIYDEEVISAYDFLDRWLSFSIVSDHTIHGLIELSGTKWLSG